MPHTRHRKKTQRTKRTEIIDEDGWTRVTTTNNSQQKPRPLPSLDSIERRHAGVEVIYPDYKLPADKTIEQVEEQYRKIEKRWLQSDSYKELERCLREAVDRDVLKDVDTCLLFGSGTFSGLLRDWIDRAHVSMYQLAAFVSVMNIIEKVTGHRPKACAQEPVYNSLDHEFLSRLSITVVLTPSGFREITTHSFVYCPYAELDVTLRTLARNPSLAMVNSKLDMYWRNENGEACTDRIQISVGQLRDPESPCVEGGDTSNADRNDHIPVHAMTKEQQERYGRIDDVKDKIEEGLAVCEGFKQNKDYRRLPALDARDEPFHDVYLFHRQPQMANDLVNEETSKL